MRRFAVLPLTIVLLLLASIAPAHGQSGGEEDFFDTFAADAREMLERAMVLHVAPDGDDENLGTAEEPLATITAARDALRERIAEGLDGSVMVRIAGGTYRITEPIVFGPEDSGSEEHPIIYAAGDDDPATISGGRAVTGWEQNGDGTWSATLDEVKSGDWRFRELFVNGERRFRARHPNEGYLRVVEAFPDKRSGFTFQPGDIPDGLSGGDLELVFLHDWSTTRVNVARIDHDQNELHAADPIGPGADHYRIDHFEQHPRYFLENHRALLDAPGEWHLDTGTGVLTYMPMEGESIEEVEAVAPVAASLLEVRGEPGEPVRGLFFKGLRFEHCAWPIPEGGYAAGQAGFHEKRDGSGGDHGLRVPMPAAVTFEMAERCGVIDSRVAHVGGSGIWFGSRTRDCALTGTVLTDIAGNGLMIGEDRSRTVDGEPWWERAPEQAASSHIVQHNLIERCGRLYYGSVGVWVGMAQRIGIARNIIRELPYTGVSVGWMWNDTPTPCKANLVLDNHIHHVMQVLSDGGGIYTLGRQPGTTLVGNVIHDVPLNTGRAESNGMFLDQGTAELIIKGNVIYNIDRSPLRFHQAEENLVRDNVLVVGEGVPKVRYNNTDPEKITLKDNRVIPAGEWEPAGVGEVIQGAGPRR